MTLNLTWILTLLIIIAVFAGIAIGGCKIMAAIANGFISIIRMIFLRKE